MGNCSASIKRENGLNSNSRQGKKAGPAASTVIRKLETQGFVTHEDFGGTHRYLLKISKEAYLGGAMAAYFDNSYKNMVAFFAREKKITPEELKDILNAIEKGE
jgi:predicted transcriptional regulator